MNYSDTVCATYLLGLKDPVGLLVSDKKNPTGSLRPSRKRQNYLSEYNPTLFPSLSMNSAK